MKKIIKLSIPIGLSLVFLIVIFSYAHGADGYSGKPIIHPGISESEQQGPPWYDYAWRYRRQLSISNSGNYLSYYQVLIKFDSSNFDFNLANDDGSDIRFTDSSGKNPISFWIESWDSINKVGYLWVLVSALPPEPYDTIIYLYYGNPDAIPASDGSATFDLFDDFLEFTGEGCDQSILSQDIQQHGSERNLNDEAFLVDNNWMKSSPWCVINGSPTVSAGKLFLPDGTGIRTNNTQRYYAFGFQASFGSGTGREWSGFIDGASGPRTMIGDLTTDVDDLYLINFVNASNNIILEGDNDWHNSYHLYEVRWNAGWSEGEIDHGASSASTAVQVPSVELPVTLYSYAGSNATLKVDWVYLRQYQYPEPSIQMGSDQGLIDLSISMVDTPDPVSASGELTYQLTITNNSIIDGPGVIVTDTLPINAVVSSIEPSQGVCTESSDVVCSLGTVQANSTAQITIIITPTIDGVITNTARVASPGYEMDLSNNVEQAVTLVDSIPPDVNWEKPVHNGQDYTAYGGFITLEASATDQDDQVSWVEFLLYDHIWDDWISIGKDYTYPYQAQFNSETLVAETTYQMFVQAADRAGNISNPLDPLRVIYIQRILKFFEYLSIIMK